MITTRTFTANVGNPSTGNAGPDAIETDIDNLIANDQELLGITGAKASLTTEDKTNLVNAINEHETQINALAPKASPTFTGIPIAPTATAGTNTTQIATTAFAKNAIDNHNVNTLHKQASGITQTGAYANAEGDNTKALGYASHAEGKMSQAIDYYTHAEGVETIASEDYSHAEGGFTIASGVGSHAEGDTTFASGYTSHSEGERTYAVSDSSHTEGRYTIACYGTLYKITAFNNTAKTITVDSSGLSVGNLIHIKIDGTNDEFKQNVPVSAVNGLVITLNTTDTITADWVNAFKMYPGVDPVTHAEGYNTIASGDTAHAEGYYTIASGNYSHAEGYYAIASGYYSHAEGHLTKATLSYSHAEGSQTIASGNISHAEGASTTASGGYSHAEGDTTRAIGDSTHTEGYNTEASGLCSHAEGADTIASANYSHAEGDTTQATGSSAHAEGADTIASGNYSHAENADTVASGSFSHAGGLYTQSRFAQFTMGQYGTISTASDFSYTSTAEALTIGNGTSTSARGLAFKVLFDGKTYADGAYASTGADYAEYFEWLDENTNNEDRVGYFVTLDGEKIRKANFSDDYIVGVITSTPSVVGDNYEAWHDKYITDEWGRIQYHDVVVPATEKLPERIEKQPIYNPEWDSSIEYISRENRKEWSAVGMMGKLLVRDDGTCQVNGYCKSNDNGIATYSLSGYRVMKRVSDNIVLVLIK